MTRSIREEAELRKDPHYARLFVALVVLALGVVLLVFPTIAAVAPWVCICLSAAVVLYSSVMLVWITRSHNKRN